MWSSNNFLEAVGKLVVYRNPLKSFATATCVKCSSSPLENLVKGTLFASCELKPLAGLPTSRFTSEKSLGDSHRSFPFQLHARKAVKARRSYFISRPLTEFDVTGLNEMQHSIHSVPHATRKNSTQVWKLWSHRYLLFFFL